MATKVAIKHRMSGMNCFYWLVHEQMDVRTGTSEVQEAQQVAAHAQNLEAQAHAHAEAQVQAAVQAHSLAAKAQAHANAQVCLLC